jgi:hypothetical protein
VLGAIGVLGVIGLVALAVLLGGEDQESGPEAGSKQDPQAAGTASASAAKGPKGLGKLSADEASSQLATAGLRAGTVSSAWGWTDKNGRNLLLTSTSRAGRRSTLKVFHVARLGSDPTTLRVMTDPNLPRCSKARTGPAGFTSKALSIRDLDGDGRAEALVGWSSRCGAAGRSSDVRLALISNGKKWIIRGSGVIGMAGSGTFRPDPKAGDWPEGYLTAATKVFRSVYY